MSDLSTNEQQCTDAETIGENAVRLLQLEKRLEAADRLYNAEIAELRTELSHLTADCVRAYQNERRELNRKRQRRLR